MRFTALAWAASAAVLSLSLASAVQAQVNWSGAINDYDGRVGDQWTSVGSKDVQVRRRPIAPDQTSLLLENYRIHDATNQKAMDIGVTKNADGSVWSYNDITIRHYEAFNINRDETTAPGLHTDFLRIAGSAQAVTPTDVTIDDAYIHDGDAMPIIIQDGRFGTIRLKDVRIENTTLQQIQLATIHSGSIEHIVVEDSPGLHLSVMEGGPIGDVTFLNSPGATAGRAYYDAPALAALTGDPITVPEPGTLGLLSIGLLVLGRRRRR